MSDLADLAFEIGKVVYKTYRDVNKSKGDSARLIQTLGGADKEEIVLQKIGKFWNHENWFDRPDGLVLVTNYRLVFLSKLKSVTVTTDYLSFPLDMIEGLEATRVWLVSPAIQFHLQGRKYTFTLLSNAGEVVEAMSSNKRDSKRAA